MPRQTPEPTQNSCFSKPLQCRWYTLHLHTPQQTWAHKYTNEPPLVFRIPACFGEKMWIYIPSIGVMLNGLGVNFTAAHVFNSQRQPLPILDFSISHSFQIGLLYLTVFSPNDLPIGVHGHGWLLTTDLQHREKKTDKNRCELTGSWCTSKIFTIYSLTYLNDDTAFIVTQSHIIGTSETAHTPNSLHAIVQSAFQAVRARMPDAHRACRENFRFKPVMNKARYSLCCSNAVNCP